MAKGILQNIRDKQKRRSTRLQSTMTSTEDNGNSNSNSNSSKDNNSSSNNNNKRILSVEKAAAISDDGNPTPIPGDKSPQKETTGVSINKEDFSLEQSVLDPDPEKKWVKGVKIVDPFSISVNEKLFKFYVIYS